jgi:hypothetical protein
MLPFACMENHSTPLKATANSDRWSIEVRATREEYGADPHTPRASEVLTIRQLLDKYSVTLGYQNAHLMEILIVLMTTGKVCVEFRAFTERFQLCDSTNILTRPATVELFNEYLVARKEKKLASGPEATRRITVQLPKFATSTVGLTPRRAPPTT